MHTPRNHGSMTATSSKQSLHENTAVRLDAETLARINALRPYFSTFWHEATESDALRAVILAGLDIVEGKAASTEKSPMPSNAEHEGRETSR